VLSQHAGPCRITNAHTSMTPAPDALTMVAGLWTACGAFGVLLLDPRAHRLASIGRGLALGPVTLAVGVLVWRGSRVERALRREVLAAAERARLGEAAACTLVTSRERTHSRSVKVSLSVDDLAEREVTNTLAAAATLSRQAPVDVGAVGAYRPSRATRPVDASESCRAD
jgi:hypothetical protein